MPTYAYRCSACDHSFDIYQSFSDDALSVCPECGGQLRKVFGSLGVTFNGSGFYRTDSRSGAGASGGTGSTASSAAPASAGSGSGSSGSGSSGSGSGGSSAAA